MYIYGGTPQEFSGIALEKAVDLYHATPVATEIFDSKIAKCETIDELIEVIKEFVERNINFIGSDGESVWMSEKMLSVLTFIKEYPESIANSHVQQCLTRSGGLRKKCAEVLSIEYG
jgi:hypothetical protein